MKFGNAFNNMWKELDEEHFKNQAPASTLADQNAPGKLEALPTEAIDEFSEAPACKHAEIVQDGDGSKSMMMPTTNTNPTVVCDGKGNYRVETFGHANPALEPEGPCLIRHEFAHIRDYQVLCPNGCKNQKNGTYAPLGDEKDIDQRCPALKDIRNNYKFSTRTECQGYNIQYWCIKGMIAETTGKTGKDKYGYDWEKKRKRLIAKQWFPIEAFGIRKGLAKKLCIHHTACRFRNADGTLMTDEEWKALAKKAFDKKHFGKK